MRSFFVASCLLSASAAAAPCFDVTYEGAAYDTTADLTTFSYRVDALGGPDCGSADAFGLAGGSCAENQVSTKGTYSVDPTGASSWWFNTPVAAGSSGTYTLTVRGEVTSEEAGQWSLWSEVSGAHVGLTCLPNCTGVEPSDPQLECPIIFAQDSVEVPVQGSVSIGISLAGNPEGPVTVNLESNCVILSACSLTFDETNFGTVQFVQLSQDPSNTQVLCTVRASTEGEVCPGSELPVRQVSLPAGNAMIYGDPNVVTFRYSRYNVRRAGVFTLIRDLGGEWEAQIRVAKCEVSGLCSFTFALQYRNYRLRADMALDGTLTVQESPNAVEEGVWRFQQDGGERVYINTLLGFSIKPLRGANTPQYSLMVVVAGSSQLAGQIGGLFGSFQGSKNQDMIRRDGTLAPTAKDLFDSWFVSPTSPTNLIAFSTDLNTPAVFPPLQGAPAFDPSVTAYACP